MEKSTPALHAYLNHCFLSSNSTPRRFSTPTPRTWRSAQTPHIALLAISPGTYAIIPYSRMISSLVSSAIRCSSMTGVRFRRSSSAHPILFFMFLTDISRHPASTKSFSLYPHILWKYTSFRSSSDSSPSKHRISSTRCRSLSFHGFKCFRIPSRINLQKITSSPTRSVSRASTFTAVPFP